MTGSYFQATITIDDTNIADHSGVAGIVAALAMPANNDRIGFVLQNISTTNDLWWGYDVGVAVGKAGCFCLPPKTAGNTKSSMYTSPPNGAYRGTIYVISDGGGRFTMKEWSSI